MMCWPLVCQRAIGAVYFSVSSFILALSRLLEWELRSALLAVSRIEPDANPL
jgi:hypothetical protein